MFKVAGSESVIVTPVAVPGPLFSTLMRYVSVLFTVTGLGEPVLVIERSAVPVGVETLRTGDILGCKFPLVPTIESG